MAGVSLHGVTKRFGHRHLAIDDVTLEIPDGSFTVLVGPSGCGKTTTLRMVAGLETVDVGEIHIGGRCVNDVPPAERDIAMVFQNYALYPHMTVAENIGFGLRLRGATKRAVTERIAEVAAMLGLEALLDRRPRQLSGGQRQRVALGRAIARRPSVFLMDEPLSNLDAQLRQQTRAELIRLHRELGATFIYVTHDQVEAMTMGESVVVMNAGRVEQAAGPRDVYLHPASAFIASFVGNPSANLLRAGVSMNGEGPVLLLAGVPFAAPPPLRDPLSRYAGREVLLGVRPEHLHLGEDGPLRARVEMTELLGHQTLVHLVCDGLSLVATVDSRLAPDSGAEARVRLDDRFVSVFDAESGRNVLTT